MQRYSIQVNDLTDDQDRMRRDLLYHFMNPKEKWKAKGTLPIKMFIIVVKLVVVTVQIIIFSENNSNEVSFVEGSKTTFKHLFLHNWQSSFETLPYPPSSGPFAIYKVEDFYVATNYALENYYKIQSQAIGPYGFGEDNVPKMTLCIVYYRLGDIFPFNHTYRFSKDILTNCTKIEPIQLNETKPIYDVQEYLTRDNFSINFHKLINADIKFSLRSIQLKSYEMDQSPDCLQFDITILFDNSNHNGQMILSLQAEMTSQDCVENNLSVSMSSSIKNFLVALDIISLILSIASLILSSRSLIKIYRFWKKVKNFFLEELKADISNKWKYFCGIGYIMIFIGDFLVISGTILKIDMHRQSRKDMDRFTLCNYFLGLGLFLGHLTLIRYFSYFPKSSILVNTIKCAMPPLLRFSVCSTLLYLAFSILGWIILGPHHIKFRTFESSIACLFSLMLGDDMFVTLSVISHNNTTIYIFSQLFIYLFCVLFIFVVLNLILTIIYEAYEEAENQGTFGTPSDVFWDFINSHPESCSFSMYKNDIMRENSLSKTRNQYLIQKCIDIFCCCVGKANHIVEIKMEDTDSEEMEASDNYSQDYLGPLESSFVLSNRQKRRSTRRRSDIYGTFANRTRVRTSQVAPIVEESSRDRGFSI